MPVFATCNRCQSPVEFFSRDSHDRSRQWQCVEYTNVEGHHRYENSPQNTLNDSGPQLLCDVCLDAVIANIKAALAALPTKR